MEICVEWRSDLVGPGQAGADWAPVRKWDSSHARPGPAFVWAWIESWDQSCLALPKLDRWSGSRSSSTKLAWQGGVRPRTASTNVHMLAARRTFGVSD